MSFNKQTIRDIDVAGKTVLVRADYNVPLSSTGKITDNYRIKQSLPTIKYLLEKHAKVVIISHLGRPEGKIDKKFSLRPVADELRHLLAPVDVKFAHDCVGAEIQKAVSELHNGEVLLLS